MADRHIEEIKKHPGGRPPKYSNVEDMSIKIEEYFNKCDAINTKANKMIKPYTINSLCLHLSITNETLNQYELLPEFSETIKRAKKRVESFLEESMYTGRVNPVSAIFGLKNNFKWQDKQEIESVNTNINKNHDESKLSQMLEKLTKEEIALIEEAQKILERLEKSTSQVN